VPEPLGGAHRNVAEAAANLERHIVRTLRELKRVPVENLLKHRYDRWRRMGKVAHMTPEQMTALFNPPPKAPKAPQATK
jgi:hypothetical protein